METKEVEIKKSKNDKRLLTIVLTVGLLAFALLRLFFRAEGEKVIVSVDGKEYGTYSLYKDNSFDVINEYGTNTVLIKNGTVEVIFADCRDQICVEHAPISTTDESIVCLPHRLVIEIVNE